MRPPTDRPRRRCRHRPFGRRGPRGNSSRHRAMTSASAGAQHPLGRMTGRRCSPSRQGCDRTTATYDTVSGRWPATNAWTSRRPVQSPTRQIVASDRWGLPMVTADASPPFVAVADRAPADICTSSRHDGCASRGRPAVSAVGARTACALALCLASAPTRRRPGQSPRHANVGRADDDAPRGTQDEALREQDDVPRGTTGTSSAPGMVAFPDQTPVVTAAALHPPYPCACSDTLNWPGEACRSAQLPARPVNRPGIGSVPSVFHVERPSGAAPAVPRPRTDLGSLSFTPCPAQTGRASAVGHSGPVKPGSRAVWAASDLFAGR